VSPPAPLHAALLPWYRATARDLPWRRTADPYAVWISEAMLQQTRVETVLDYYPRFLSRLPDAVALAEASEEEVLALWSGLGYYRRARSLHAAARVIVEEHGGSFPRERSAALALPGVGRYTAGAVLSIGYGLPEPVVDGNVERVFARLFLLEERAGSAALGRAVWARAEELVPAEGAGEWNQALMELGALVCTPRAAHCRDCPLRSRCGAHRAGRVGELPRPRQRPAAVAVELELAFAEDRGRLLLERRPEGGRLAGLWQLPTIELEGPEGKRAGLFPDAWPDGVELTVGETLARLTHSITRHRIRACVRAAQVRGELPEEWRYFDLRARRGLPLTGMAKKALSKLQRRGEAAEGA